MSIVSTIGSVLAQNAKKRISRVTLAVFVFQIFSPVFTYAALPSFDATVIAGNIAPVTEVVDVSLPRVLVAGDVLSLDVNSSTITQ